MSVLYYYFKKLQHFIKVKSHRIALPCKKSHFETHVQKSEVWFDRVLSCVKCHLEQFNVDAWASWQSSCSGSDAWRTISQTAAWGITFLTEACLPSLSFKGRFILVQYKHNDSARVGLSFTSISSSSPPPALITLKFMRGQWKCVHLICSCFQFLIIKVFVSRLINEKDESIVLCALKLKERIQI